MSIIGNTISFAGIPSINAVSIYPSNPINRANGSKKFAIYVRILISPMFIFANNHITRPAGAATATALPSTNKVLSNIDLISTCPICGFLYGGSSNTNDELVPFNIVFDRILETSNVINIPSKITPNTVIVAIMEEPMSDDSTLFPLITAPAIKMLAIVIKNGNLPLQGINAFVSIAISFSLGESIILQPVTPAALHPNPMHIVRACLP